MEWLDQIELQHVAALMIVGAFIYWQWNYWKRKNSDNGENKKYIRETVKMAVAFNKETGEEIEVDEETAARYKKAINKAMARGGIVKCGGGPNALVDPYRCTDCGQEMQGTDGICKRWVPKK